MLSFDRVSFRYPAYTAGAAPSGIITDVSLEIRRGDFAALIGENGAGKSTLCRLANGLLKPVSGTVLVSGRDTRTVKTSVLARTVGYLFQNPDRQLCRNTVREELVFGLEYSLAGLSPAETEREKKRRCDEMLDLFGLDGNRDPFGLSRGERQQCALASVLARKPEILILDEPTTGLDYRECTAIMDIISRLHAGGTTILMISHDMEIVSDFARRCLVLSGGRLIGDGPAREIIRNRPVLDRASLLPPQIVSLAMKLGAGFGDVFSVDDMVSAAEHARGGRL
jgi:energy-coupling factor transport system ATP-binding protein